MSHPVNDIHYERLHQRAAEAMDYFESKLPAKLIQQALEYNDLDMLERVVEDAEKEMSIQSFHNNDILGERDVY